MKLTKLNDWLSRVNQKSAKSKPASLYEMIGGEQTTTALCQRFYDIMEQDPKAAELRAIHSQDLSTTRQKFLEFMTGWLGGPPLYEQKYGHPRLRARHLHVKVDELMISQWLYCMSRALEESVTDYQLRQVIWNNLQPLARHMKNH
ncbi:group II truncated hemoglobin [Lacimicrobium alkaliphilum]|uniref:group II truncated hemoglobin n=1 Tax=Lacimicrobium alkaliphilum TaxID=1526571 RepID=UPI0009EA3619|nr:group II truncated hemoglobin [Lacimicrobium alkaliphilum]